jgi:hypothetical protein
LDPGTSLRVPPGLTGDTTGRFRGAARLNRSPNRREESSPAQRCNLVSHPPYRKVRRIRTRPLHSTGVHRYIFGHCFPSLADTLPPFPMYAALPRSEYYDGSAPPAPSVGVAPIPPISLAGSGKNKGGNGRGWFPRSLLSGQRVRHPALPLRHRHDYAVDFHHGLLARATETQPGVSPPSWVGARRKIQPRSTGFRAGGCSRGVTTPVSRVYLPISLTAPGPSGSPEPTRLCRGCSHPPRRPPDQAASSFTSPLRRQRNGRPLTSIRNNSASWRTR